MDKGVEVGKRSTDYLPQTSKETKLNGAFEKIMIVDYALREDLKIIPTIEKYKLLNEKTIEKVVKEFYRTKSGILLIRILAKAFRDAFIKNFSKVKNDICFTE